VSDIPADWRGQLDIRAEIARIDRERAETAKLTKEAQKFIAEHDKLMAEGRKLDRERWLAPLTAGATLLAAGAALGGTIIALLLRMH
jgi:hypothetical protein